jgi:hypothetical protein
LSTELPISDLCTDSLRMEKAYRAGVANSLPEITPIERRIGALRRFQQILPWTRSQRFPANYSALTSQTGYVSVKPRFDCLGHEPFWVQNPRNCDILSASLPALQRAYRRSSLPRVRSTSIYRTGTHFDIRILGKNCPATVLKDACMTLLIYACAIVI